MSFYVLPYKLLYSRYIIGWLFMVCQCSSLQVQKLANHEEPTIVILGV
jgi:hypothetical protein